MGARPASPVYKKLLFYFFNFFLNPPARFLNFNRTWLMLKPCECIHPTERCFTSVSPEGVHSPADSWDFTGSGGGDGGGGGSGFDSTRQGARVGNDRAVTASEDSEPSYDSTCSHKVHGGNRFGDVYTMVPDTDIGRYGDGDQGESGGGEAQREAREQDDTTMDE